MASVLKNSNTLLKALNNGSGLSFGAWQMLPGTHLSRAIARSGFDWICIDTEHGNIAGESRFMANGGASGRNSMLTRVYRGNHRR